MLQTKTQNKNHLLGLTTFQYQMYLHREKMADALAGAIQANRHADIFKTFDFIEDHDRAILAGRTLAGPAGAYVTIDAGEFGVRVDFGPVCNK